MKRVVAVEESTETRSVQTQNKTLIVECEEGYKKIKNNTE